MIEWEFSIGQQEQADHVLFIRWNLAAMLKEDDNAAEKLWKELEGQIAHLDEECTGDEVERDAEWCHDTQSKVLDTTVKKIRICARSRRWWNSEIKERRTTFGREKRRGKWSSAAVHTQVELRRSISRSKSRMWKEYLLNLRVGEVWQAAKFVNPRAGATVRALPDREGTQANTIPEKGKMLTAESIPMNDGDLYYKQPPAGEVQEDITDQLVERALFSLSVKKAPGPD